MIEGMILKGIGGFYYVKTDNGIYECRARGVFREEKITPFVGDIVLIRENETDKTGYIEKIYPRKSKLIRPPVTNVTQALIVISMKNPDPNLWLLDRFLILARHEGLNTIICLNKIDLVDCEEFNAVKSIYQKAGYNVIATSPVLDVGIDELRDTLENNITVFSGPSGVGKSSLLNKVQPNLQLKTGEISDKTKRGKHTTRHVELLELDNGGYVLDTPGFSSLDIDFIDNAEGLKKYFDEINSIKNQCRFNSCLHYKEPDCEVKRLVEVGEISKIRYENYIRFLEEIRNRRRY